MKLNPRLRGERALTSTEVMLVVVMLTVLAALGMVWIQGNNNAKREKAARIKCVGNTMATALGYKVFAYDNDDKFPFATTNALAGTNDHTLWLHFQAMSNELGSAKVLMCPVDSQRINNMKADFTSGPMGLASAGNAAISYGGSLDTFKGMPNTILLLDRNLVTNAWNLRGKVFLASSNRPPEWDARQHRHCGNFALADGSVQQASNVGLAIQVRQQDVATNRLLLPLLP